MFSEFGINVFWTFLFALGLGYYIIYVAGLLKSLSRALGINIVTVKDHPMPRLWNSLFMFPLGKKYM